MQWLLLFTCCHPKNARSNQDCGSCSKRQENKGWFSWLLAHWGVFPLPVEYPDYPEHFVLSTLFHFSTACCKKPKADSSLVCRSSCGEEAPKLEAVAALGVKKWGWTWNAPIDNLCSTAHLNSSEFNPSIHSTRNSWLHNTAAGTTGWSWHQPNILGWNQDFSSSYWDMGSLKNQCQQGRADKDIFSVQLKVHWKYTLHWKHSLQLKVHWKYHQKNTKFKNCTWLTVKELSSRKPP